jgi:AGCS family alanine or glycine:cation symporter
VTLLSNLLISLHFLGQIPDGVEDAVEAINNPLNNFAWGWPTIILIATTGIVLMTRLKGMPLIRLPDGMRMMFRPPAKSEEGEISPFQALMTSMAATVGTGNIVGVASAIAIGGPGSIFWMWVIAILGIATKYAETVLSVHYREVNALGNHVGGPMYYIRNGLGPDWAWLGGIFALFGMMTGFGIGNGVQCFEISSALALVGVPRLLTGVVLGLLVFSVIIGGIKRIAQTASVIVPIMCVFYVIASLVILLNNITEIPSAFTTIFSNAFTGKAAAGGTLAQVLLMGFKRGIFSNESGLGSASIAHASAKTNDPVRQGTVAMLGTFIDTLVICTMTALVIITTGAYQSGALGADLSIAAFNLGMPGSGVIVTSALIVFGLTTVLGWALYSERCTEFLFGVNAILPFRLIFVGVVVIGSVAGDRGVIWDVADTLNGLMAIPNLIALLLLSGTVIQLTRKHRLDQS